MRRGARRGAGLDPVMIWLCVGGLVARLVLNYAMPSIAHADETFQYIEPAYRVVTGRGLIPWEYVVGARSWFIPGLVIPVVAGARAISHDPAVTLWAVTVFISLWSLVTIVAAFVIARRAAGRLAGIFAGLLTAFWCEIVYLSSHVLADTVSVVPLMAGLALIYRWPAPGGRRLFAAGALFGLATMLRPQLAPAIAIVPIWILGVRDWRPYVPAAGGAMAAILLVGLLDWPTWGMPFRSIVVYVWANGAGIANIFGVRGRLYYVGSALGIWWGSAIPILLTAAIGARRLPLFAVMGLMILLTFSAVGHKEYRFVYPALPLLFTLCGVGTADMLRAAARRMTPARARAAAFAVAAVWLGASIGSARRAPMRTHLTEGDGAIEAVRLIDRDPSACGVTIDRSENWWAVGRVRLRDDLTLYDIGAGPTSARHGYNAILAFPDAAHAAAYRRSGFVPKGCFGSADRVCLFRRAAPCDGRKDAELRADPGPEVRGALEKFGMLPPAPRGAATDRRSNSRDADRHPVP